MNEKVNYEENLFYISMNIKKIQQSFELNISPEYFHERQAEDIIFIFHTLQKILRELTNNNFLINRNQYLYSMLKVQDRYISMLKQFLTIDSQSSLDRDQFSQLRKALETIENDRSDIRDILNQDEQIEVEKDLISNEELNFLMAPGLENDSNDF